MTFCRHHARGVEGDAVEDPVQHEGDDGGQADAQLARLLEGVVLVVVRRLEALPYVESPERQAKLESLARSYASGSYKVDAEATASKIIDDAFEN